MESGSLTDSLRETLAVFDGQSEPRTTPEVADCLDLGRRSTYARLERLVEQDRIETKKVGANARVWWRPPSAGHVDEDHAGRRDRKQFESLVDAVEEYAIFVLDPDGYVQSWNLGAERITGYAAAEIVGEHFSTFYTDDDRDADLPDRNLARAAARGSIEDEGWRVRADGSRFWANVTITAIHDDDGDLQGYAKVTRDMTDRKRVETERELLLGTTRAIAEAETFEDGLETALHTLGEASDWKYAEAWLPTDHGTLRRAEADYVEGAGAEFAEISEDVVFERGEGLPGRVWMTGEFEWASSLAADSCETYPRRDEALDAGLKSAFGVPIVANGDVVAVLTFCTSEIREADERFVRTVSSVAAKLGNLVVRRQLEVQVEHERDLVDRILETSPVGIVVLDRDGEPTRLNDRAMEILEIPDDRVESYTVADRPVYDTDGNRVTPDDHAASRTLATGDPVYDWQARVEVPESGHRWLSVNAAPIFDADGDIERVVTTGEDITQLKEQANRLERQRDELEDELEEIFGRIDDGFIALDEELRLVHVNERTQALLDRSAGELTGEYLWDVFEPAPKATDAFDEALETREPVSYERYYEPFDTWFETHVYPSETGLSVYFRDVSERKDRERELERYETIVETVHDGIYVVDQDGRFTMVNDTYESMTGYASEDLVGSHVSRVIDDEETLRQARRLETELAAGERNTASLEAELTTPDGETRIGEATFALMESGAGYERVGVVRDVTERKERQRELQLYETIVEAVRDGIYVLDDDFTFTEVNDAYVEMTGYSREELLGTHCSLVISEDVSDASFERTQEIADQGGGSAVIEADLHRDDGSSLRAESRFTAFQSDDGEVQKVGVVRDVSERVARERELRNRVRQQEVVTDLGKRALEDNDLDTLLADAVRLVADTLGTDYCQVLDLDPDAKELRVRQGIGWNEEVVGAPVVSATAEDSQAVYTLTAGGPVVVEDFATESRFTCPPVLVRHDVHSGICTVVGPLDDPWGILCTHDGDPAAFSDHDAAFVQSVANILASAIDRHHDEQRLVHQNEQLAALNNLNEALHGIIGDVVDQSTREEIEATVCDRLAASESYQFAWIGEADATTQLVEVRTKAGIEGYLDEVTISVDPDDERSEGATGRAFRTGELQTTHDVEADPRHEPWRESLTRYDFQSLAAIPIVHEETVYGVLNVYADRPKAFEGHEAELLAQLGEVVGHAIAATERKQALMSDEVVELAFQIEDVFGALDFPFTTAGTITLDHAVPLGDDEYLVYGAATPDAVDTVTDIVEALPHWESVSFHGEDDPVSFQLRLSDPPVLSTVAALGGTVKQAIIEDGDYRMTIHLATSVDVHRVVDAVEETYPRVELLRRRQRSRIGNDPQTAQRQVLTALTDQQRAALEAAYHGGYFRWPRDQSGEEVAGSLDIASATFHQHLRKAERKVFDSVLPGTRDDES